MIVDQSGWGAVRVTGEDAVRFVHSMCTANVERLADGDHVWACMLNAKGRVLSVFDVCRQGEELLLLVHPGTAEATKELLDRHAIMDEVEFAVETPTVHRVWSDPASVWTAPPVFAPAVGAEDGETRRIEGGFPLMGVDVSEERFPFEGPLDRFVDHQKGCYVGQEPVARVRDRGQAQRYFRGLLVAGEEPVLVGAAVTHEGKEIGAVTSQALSPRFGRIALAYLKRGGNEPGQSVQVDGREAEVKELPFAC